MYQDIIKFLIKTFYNFFFLDLFTKEAKKGLKP